MSGTMQGGRKAAATNKKKHGDDFYKKIGSLGGRATGKKGFALNPELAKKAGRKGGLRSKRTGVTTGQGKKKEYYYNGDGVFNTDTPKPEPKKRTFIDRVLGR